MILKKLYKRKIFQGATLFIIDSIFFGVTDPKHAPSAVIIIAFLLATLSLLWLANAFYRLASWYGLPLKHRRRAVLSSTVCLMGLMSLQSFGQLSIRDIILLLPFVAVAYLYFSFQKTATQA